MVKDEVKRTIKLKRLVEHFGLKILYAGKDYENPLAFDPPEIGQEYGIVLTVREEDKDAQWAKDLQACMSSEKARDIVVDYFGTASIHIFDYSQDSAQS